VVLEYRVLHFVTGSVYTEPEVNELGQIHHTFDDWALLRRDMCDFELLSRSRDGARY